MTRLLTLFALSTAALFADSVNYTEVVSTQTAFQYCGPEEWTCSPFTITVPQFNPALGSLDAVAWLISDEIHFQWGINDMMAQTLPAPYDFALAEGVSSDVLGLNASNTQERSGSLGWYGNSYDAVMDETYLTASGFALDSSPFIGSGSINVAIQPLLSDQNFATLAAFPMLLGEWDQFTLAVVYDAPASAIPEPAELWAPIVFLLLVGVLGIKQQSKRWTGK